MAILAEMGMVTIPIMAVQVALVVMGIIMMVTDMGIMQVMAMGTDTTQDMAVQGVLIVMGTTQDMGIILIMVLQDMDMVMDIIIM